MVRRAIRFSFYLFVVGSILLSCKKKEIPGTEELRQLFTQTAQEFQAILPELDDNATPDKVRHAAERVEHVFQEQYKTAKELIAKYPNLLADRPKYQVALKREMEALRMALQKLIQRIQYWTPKMKHDKVFNATLERISSLNMDIENQTRPQDGE